MGKVTIRDVARAADVGIGTVSRVLNNSPHVSDSTRRRVLTIMGELGFKPNAVARQLPRKANFQTIAVITLPFYEYYSFAERLRGVQQALQPYQTSYELTLYNTHSLHDYDERLMSIIDMGVMVGLLVIDLDLTDRQKSTLRKLNIPFVGLNHYRDTDWPCIGTDNYYGGYLAGKYLLELGHRRIAYVGNDLVDAGGFNTSQERFEGFLAALAEFNLMVNPAYVKFGNMGYDIAKQHTLELCSLPEPPTAIFAMSDTQALGCIAAVREWGLQVPDDISIIGYDDLEVSYHVGLTTIRQHLELSGKMAMNYLLKLLNNHPNPPKPALPPLKIIVRGTTRAIL